MFQRLGRLAIRLRFFVLAGAAVVALAGLGYGSGAPDHLVSGGFDDPGSDSFELQERLVSDLGLGEADIIAVFGDESTSIDDAAFASSVERTLSEAGANPHVTNVDSVYSTGSEALVSFDRTQTFAVISLGGDEDAKIDALPEVEEFLRASDVPVQLGGITYTFDVVSDQVEEDLRRAELLAFAVLAVLLVLVFGSLVAAFLPLVIGALAILTTMITLRLYAQVADVSIFSLNTVILLGLGLAIDYSLIMVNRYREELGKGFVPNDAIVRTVSTAGKTIAFSGVAVAASMLALLFFPQLFLRSMGLGGALVAFIAVFWSLTVLPGILAVLGPRVNSLSIRRAWIEGNGSSFWSNTAGWVMRRPLIVGGVVAAVLIVVSLPFFRIELNQPDSRVLGEGAEPRQVFELMRDGDRFPANETTPVQVLVDTSGDPLAPDNIDRLSEYVDLIAEVEGVQRVDSVVSLDPTLGPDDYKALYSQPRDRLDPMIAAFVDRATEGDATLLTAVVDSHPMTDRALDATRDIQSLTPPPGTRSIVGGESANFLDSREAVLETLPLALAFIAVVTFVALFVAFGSVVIPIKAMIMNFLTLGAAFGVLVLIFQDGRFESILEFESVGAIDLSVPLFSFAVVFGLSMDYEVFLLSRIKEEYDATGDNGLSVARGLERTGRIITSAALLLVVVMAAFATSQIIFIKELGVGGAFAIALDATIIRALLVPATMRLMGDWNWWAPAPLHRLWLKLGIGNLEADPEPELEPG